MARVGHGFGPFYSEDSEILILGSFPSVKSREESFYYAHPQNRFWRVIAACCGESVPLTLDDKRGLLLLRRLALWDVIDSCEIRGSSDASIRDVVPADIAWLCGVTSVSRVILNGRTAEKFYRRYDTDLKLPVSVMPSTSPANASWTLEKLVGVWGEALGVGRERR